MFFKKAAEAEPEAGAPAGGQGDMIANVCRSVLTQRTSVPSPCLSSSSVGARAGRVQETDETRSNPPPQVLPAIPRPARGGAGRQPRPHAPQPALARPAPRRADPALAAHQVCQGAPRPLLFSAAPLASADRHYAPLTPPHARLRRSSTRSSSSTRAGSASTRPAARLRASRSTRWTRTSSCRQRPPAGPRARRRWSTTCLSGAGSTSCASRREGGERREMACHDNDQERAGDSSPR